MVLTLTLIFSNNSLRIRTYEFHATFIDLSQYRSYIPPTHGNKAVTGSVLLVGYGV